MELPQRPSRHARAILSFPDRHTAWVVVLVASLRQPAELDDLVARLGALHRAAPLVGARLRDELWHPGPAPIPQIVDHEPLEDPRLDAAFDLADEPPLRVILGGAGRRLALAGHHAAFDGLALSSILACLLGGPAPPSVVSPAPGPTARKSPIARRLILPADRVAPSSVTPSRDSFESADIAIHGSSITARLAEACVSAASARNLSLATPWHRIGITVAKGGPVGVGNVASYRRVDLHVGDPVGPAVIAALATDAEPPEQVRAGLLVALARPLVNRLSDSVLLSNLGSHRIPGAERLEFFPVARGRSAVAFGAATVEGATSTLTMRARDLTSSDARALVLAAASRFNASALHLGDAIEHRADRPRRISPGLAR